MTRFPPILRIIHWFTAVMFIPMLAGGWFWLRTMSSTDPTKTTDILVRVTLPAGATAPDPAKKPTVNLEVTSGNDPTKKDPTKDIVNLPGLKFGDLTPAGGIDPAPVVPATPAPGKADPTDPTAISVDPAICKVSSDAYLPMGVQNLGTQPDRFVVSGDGPLPAGIRLAFAADVVGRLAGRWTLVRGG